MANMTVTELDFGGPIYFDPIFEDQSLRFAAAATYLKGTILARALTSAESYTGVITGTGTRVTTIAANAGRDLKPGAYTLTVGDVTAGVGPGTLVDPDGIAQTVTLAASGAQVFSLLGVTLTIAASGTALADADVIVFTVVAGEDLVPFSPTGSNGAQDPCAVLTYEVVATGAGAVPCRALIEGRVVKERLVIHGVADLDDLTQVHLDKLRAAGVTALSVRDLSVIENYGA